MDYVTNTLSYCLAVICYYGKKVLLHKLLEYLCAKVDVDSIGRFDKAF